MRATILGHVLVNENQAGSQVRGSWPLQGQEPIRAPTDLKNLHLHSCLKNRPNWQKPKGVLESGTWMLCPLQVLHFSC